MKRDEYVALVRADAEAAGNDEVMYLCDHFPHKLAMTEGEQP